MGLWSVWTKSSLARSPSIVSTPSW